MHMKSGIITLLMAGLLAIGCKPSSGAEGNAAPQAAAAASHPTESNHFNVQLSPDTSPSAAVSAPDKADLSYAAGIFYANSISNDIMNRLGLEPRQDFDMSRFLVAISNALTGLPTTSTPADAVKVLQQQQAYERAQFPDESNKLVALGPANKLKSEQFMADVASKPNMVKLPSGVVYSVTKQGDGPQPGSADTVTLTFRGSLIDGKEIMRGEHASVPMTPHPLIPQGLRDALKEMKAGTDSKSAPTAHSYLK
jgi:FKBP-type peptidyl-prolyl cis-trans isomerase